MIKKITYHQRLLWVLIGGAVFAILLFQFSISDTIELLNENGQLTEEIAKSKNAPQEIKSIKTRLQEIEQHIGKEIKTDVDIHQELLQVVTAYCQNNNIILKEFPLPYSMEEKGYLTKTAMIKAEGNFIDLLQLIHFLEHNFKYGKIVSSDFNAKKELRTGKRKLTVTVYLQNVTPLNNDKKN